MTTAYAGATGDGTAGLSKLSYIPLQTRLPRSKRKVEVGPFLKSDVLPGMELMNLIIREGRSWPFEEEFDTETEYSSYFLSHTAFVVRALEDGVDADGKASPAGALMGMFYIKPNFPGRCSHVCNGGFITWPVHRGSGVAVLMGHVFLQAARDLGYKSSYFNLVFRSNQVSVRLWESLGFERVAVLEEAARLKGIEGLDTAYGYSKFMKTEQNETIKVLSSNRYYLCISFFGCCIGFDLTKLPPDYLFRSVEPLSK